MYRTLSACLGLIFFISCSTNPYKFIDPDRDGLHAIRHTLMDNLSKYRSCYQREIDKYEEPALVKEYIVKVEFEIHPEGNVKKPTISQAIPETMKKCLEKKLIATSFPPVKDNSILQVSQPINFHLPKRN
jgi:hypothetical protein